MIVVVVIEVVLVVSVTVVVVVVVSAAAAKAKIKEIAKPVMEGFWFIETCRPRFIEDKKIIENRLNLGIQTIPMRYDCIEFKKLSETKF